MSEHELLDIIECLIIRTRNPINEGGKVVVPIDGHSVRLALADGSVWNIRAECVRKGVELCVTK